MKVSTWVRYQIERWMLRGSPAMLALLILLLTTIATAGAFIAYFTPGEHFESPGAALWWAVLRISDPGYLSDDIPDLRIRVLSVILSILGMAVTVGGIVAVVSQKMNRTLAHLAEATTPVPFSDHVVLLGWTDRTPRLLEQLLRASSTKIVVLIEKVTTEEVRRLARAIPSKSDLERVVLRRGHPARRQDLGRAACAEARVIILPATAANAVGDADVDPRTLKTLLALRTVFTSVDTPAPHVIVEVIDRNMIHLVEATLPKVSVLHSDRLISRALRIGLQAHEMLQIAPRIVRPHQDWVWKVTMATKEIGQKLGELDGRSGDDCLVGVTRLESETPRLSTHSDYKVVFGDGLVHLVAAHQATLGSDPVSESELDRLLAPTTRRVLVLGWSEVMPDLIDELTLEDGGRYHVDIVSPVEPDVRQKSIASLPGAERVLTTHVEGHPTRLHTIDEIDVSTYDRFLVVSDRTGSPEAADARTLAVVLELDRQRSKFKPGAYVTAELLEPEDLEILQNVDSVVTPILIADVLASLAETPESQESLELVMLLQRAFVSRAIDLPVDCQWNERALRAALRKRGFALLQVLAPTAKRPNHRVLIAEPVDPIVAHG